MGIFRIPPHTEDTGHASEAMQDPMPLGHHATIPLREITVRASRSSGPGGQHANVTASRVEAVFEVEASAALSDEHKRRILARVGPRVVAVAQDSRGQARNRELALERLQRRLTSALAVQRRRRPTKPTAASRAKRLDAKRRQSQRKGQRRAPGREDY
jgi:ribosome-associated protein